MPFFHLVMPFIHLEIAIDPPSLGGGGSLQRGTQTRLRAKSLSEIPCASARHVYYFGVFCALWCISGENTVILGAPPQRRQMGIRGYHAPNNPHKHASECIFWQLAAWVTQICTRLTVCGACWGMVPTVTHSFALGGFPNNDRGFTKNAPKCTKHTKIAQNGQK